MITESIFSNGSSSVRLGDVIDYVTNESIKNINNEMAPFKQLFEIMVPTISNEGKPFRTRHHKEWDRRVRKITNGMTIYTPAKGQWIDEDSGELFIERMIPVRIACTKSEMYEIMEITAKHYNQIDVMAYVVSDVVLFYKAEKQKLN